MFTRPFYPDRFLQSVAGSEPFLEYCRLRQIPFEQRAGGTPSGEDARRWTAALAQLPHEQHAQVELELATVNELSGVEENAHLVEAAGGVELPPDSISAGAPLALWFFLNHSTLFQEVFLHHEIQEVESGRTAKARAELPIADLGASTDVVREALRRFFHAAEGTGRFCTVNAYRLTEAICFVAQVADRLQFVDVFSDSGKLVRQKVRPAVPILFVYYPADGTVLLKSHLRAVDRVTALLDCFGQAALGSAIEVGTGAFDLERLKFAFHPLPDGDDMEMVRVKSLHLRYPGRIGRRQLKLETLSSDEASAIEQLLAAHVDAGSLAQLQVVHAALQVRLRVSGRGKNYLIRLWPHRCNLSQTPLGNRFRACLRRWGLSHA